MRPAGCDERFQVEDTPLAGLFRITRSARGDSRGWIERLYCSELFAACGIDRPLVQINRSRSATAGTLRGLHFQYPPQAEAKFVQCLSGSVFDVAVDLRAGSPSFLRWYGTELSAENAAGLLIPEGFAHGFQCLAQNSELLYLHTAAYAPAAEGGLDALDPGI